MKIIIAAVLALVVGAGGMALLKDKQHERIVLSMHATHADQIAQVKEEEAAKVVPLHMTRETAITHANSWDNDADCFNSAHIVPDELQDAYRAECYLKRWSSPMVLSLESIGDSFRHVDPAPNNAGRPSTAWKTASRWARLTAAEHGVPSP